MFFTSSYGVNEGAGGEELVFYYHKINNNNKS